MTSDLEISYNNNGGVLNIKGRCTKATLNDSFSSAKAVLNGE